MKWRNVFCRYFRGTCPERAKRVEGLVLSVVEGFTFIEIMVVVTIIALLTVGGIVSYSKLSTDSRDAARKNDLENIRAALEMYKSSNDFYPLNLSTLMAGSETYIKSIPVDPKGTGYQDYAVNYSPLPAGCNNTTTYCISYSLGYKLESVTAGTPTPFANPYGLQ